MRKIHKAKEIWKDFWIIMAIRPADTLKALAGSVLVAGAWFLIQFTNSCLLRTVAGYGQESRNIVVILLFLFGLYCVSRIPTISGYWLSGLSAERIVGSMNKRQLRSWLFCSREKRLQMSEGKVLSLLLNDSGNVMSDFLFMGFTIHFVEPFLLGILSILVFALWKPVVLLPFLILGMPSVILNRFFQKKVKEYSALQRETFDGLTSFFQYLSEQLTTIRESGIQNVLFEKGERTIRRAVSAEQKKENTLRYAQFVSNLLEDTGLISSVAVCILLMSRQKIQMSDLAFIFALAPFIFRFFNCFTNTWNYLTDVYTSVRRLKELASADKENEGKKEESRHVQNGALQITHLTFAYPGQAPVLRDISFAVPFQEHCVLTGVNGAGKSTLMKLLLGDLTPQTGEITIVSDKQTFPCTQRFFAYVPQEPELLNISFYENMTLDCCRFGKVSDRNEVEEYAEMLGIHDRILCFPDGYDTVVTENGKDLSLGEKQKICLIRALLSPAPCVLMDEPEHGLDTKTREAFFECLRQNQRMVIMISHTKDSLKFFNKEVNLQNGILKRIDSVSKIQYNIL